MITWNTTPRGHLHGWVCLVVRRCLRSSRNPLLCWKSVEQLVHRLVWVYCKWIQLYVDRASILQQMANKWDFRTLELKLNFVELDIAFVYISPEAISRSFRDLLLFLLCWNLYQWWVDHQRFWTHQVNPPSSRPVSVGIAVELEMSFASSNIS